MIADLKYIAFTEIFPKYYSDALFWIFCFSGLYILMPHVFAFLFPKHHAVLPDKKRADFNSYICSSFHHFVVVPMAIYRMYSLSCSNCDLVYFPFSTTLVQAVNEQSKALLHCECAPFTVGYIVSDTLFYALPEAYNKGKYEYLIHHILGMMLFWVVPLVTSDVAIFCGRVLIMESTSILFTVAYVLRNTGHANSIFVSIFEIAFAVDFFIVRIVNFFDIMYNIVKTLIIQDGPVDSEKRLTGWILFGVFVPIVLLQVYWFVIIARKSVERFMSKKTDQQAKKIN